MDLTRTFPVVDLRDELPKHVSKTWGTRALTDICGIVLHHTATTQSVVQAAHAHVLGDAPGLRYHFWINPDGEVLWCNDLEDVTWAQGGAGSRVWLTQPNQNFVSIAIAGDHTKPMTNYPEAEVAARWLIMGLQVRLQLEPDMVFGHGEFKATLCPGRLQELVGTIRSLAPWKTWAHWPDGVRDLQKMLIEVGEDPGVVDGLWGPNTAGALRSATGWSGLTHRAVSELVRRRERLVADGLL